MHPIGLMQLASCLITNCKNATVDIFDYEASKDISEPDYSKYEIIGLTGTSVHIPHACEIINNIRAINSEACIIMGGPHATFARSDLLNAIPGLDCIIAGECEISFAEFINSYTDRHNLPQIKGLVTRSNNSMLLSTVIDNLDLLPNLAYDYVNIDNYQLSTHRNALPRPFVSLITSRGCPFSCSYCQTPQMFGTKIRYRSPQLIYTELAELQKKHGIRSVVFWDDTFTANKEHVRKLCAYLKTLGLKWMCNTRVDCVDDSILSTMKDSGCEIIFFGVESFDIGSLTMLNRTTRESSVTAALNLCKKNNIRTVTSLMIGTPADNLVSIDENVNKLISLKPDDIYISIFNATIGSKVYEWAKKTKQVDLDINWCDPKRFRGTPYGLPTINNNLSRYQLQQAQKTAYRKFYGNGNETQYE